MDQLNASREEIKVEILSAGKSGIFGVGTEKAVIQVERLSPMPELEEDAHNKKNVAEVAGEILETLLDLMDIDATTMPESLQTTNGEEQVTPPLAFNIQGEDLGILIGRRGQTLAALQYVVRLIINQQMKVWTPVVIDVEGYKQRRSESLQALAVRMAEQVRIKGEPFTLEPMPAYERRIIHLALTDHPDVITESTGEGDARKVVILPDQGSQS